MKILKLTAIVPALFAFLLSTLPVHAVGSNEQLHDAPSLAKPNNQLSSAPLAYMMFCIKKPSHCQADDQSIVSHGVDLLNLLKRVNNDVNRKMRAKREKRDIWSVGSRVGDCEDFALTKRRDLIASGLPAGALRMAVVYTEKGEGHAILVVKTDMGDLVLDNRRKDIRLSYNTGYEFVKMATANPMQWLKLDSARYLFNQSFDYYT